ncbi:GntR family transcriptional regulator [uncultured Tateyamaria sp.]|uniref:GntR family transcriptional regulator n=1 Tax=uncultured Tateyamaria sp. TaxID=455651 RepID=UPI002612BFAB|nr:GntR family transcriptional regulator [uncultured Tateyamaria sp.]
MGAMSNVERAVAALRQMIFSGELPPGSDHLESELADRLGMSRTPVREAALMLQAQGLVEMRPRRGIRISPVSASDMAEIYDILTELESLAAARAAEAEYSRNDLKTLATAIRDMESALAADDLRAWAEADDRFHRELVRLGGNARLSMVVSVMRDQVRRARATTLFMRPKPNQSNEDHRRVYQAIAERDPQTAHDVHHAHRQAARDMLVALLDKHQFYGL